MALNRFGGIDTGAHGAMCVVNRKGSVVGHARSMLLAHGRDSNNPADRYDISGSHGQLRQRKGRLLCDRVLIEKPFRPARPRGGYRISARDESYLWFSYALWHAQLIILEICDQENIHPVSPRHWKEKMDDGSYEWRTQAGKSGKAKKASVDFAMRLCPSQAFRKLIVNTPGDLKHGYAEAYLIALFCVQQFKHEKE